MRAAGGIAAVIRTLDESELARRFDLVYVETHADAGALGKAYRALSGIARAAGLLAARKVDLVYLHTSSDYSLRRKAVVAVFAGLLRRPYVVHVHGSHFDSWYREAARWEQFLVRWTLGRAALVIALSPIWVARLEAIVECEATAIPNPVAIPDEHAGLTSSEPCIVSLGRLGERKGSLTVVHAFALLAHRYPSARLVLAGDGDVEAVGGAARRLGVDHRVQLPGWIGPEERARTLLGATVFVLPAREEGLPVALLEAMAYGLPALVSPVGGIPDVFVEGRHGYFVPPDDPEALAARLVHILDDPGAAREMGQHARADAAEHFAVDVVAARIIHAFVRVLEGSPDG